jgi:hypothetical protein
MAAGEAVPCQFVNKDCQGTRQGDHQVSRINSHEGKARKRLNHVQSGKELCPPSFQTTVHSTKHASTVAAGDANKLGTTGPMVRDGVSKNDVDGFKQRVIVFRNSTAPRWGQNRTTTRQHRASGSKENDISIQQPSKITRLVGSAPRGDPFGSFPVQSTTVVQDAFDYCE